MVQGNQDLARDRLIGRIESRQESPLVQGGIHVEEAIPVAGIGSIVLEDPNPVV